MDEKMQRLRELIVRENVSAVQTMESEIGLDREEIISLIQILVDSGEIQGTMSNDGTRFWRSDAKISEAPAIPREEDAPQFLQYDTRPGSALSVLGCVIILAALIITFYASDTIEQDFGAGLLFFGLLPFLLGLYWIARRKTPS